MFSAQIIYFATGITNDIKIYCGDFVVNIGTWQTCEETPPGKANVVLHLCGKADSLSITVNEFYQNK